MSVMHNSFEQSVKTLGQILKGMPYKYNLKIHTCYNLTVPPLWEIEERMNEDFHLLFIVRGGGHYLLDNVKESFEKGKIILVSSNFKHSGVQDIKNPPKIIPIRFGIYDNYSHRPFNSFFNPFSIAFRPHNIQQYQLLFESLYEYFSMNASQSHEIICNSIISQILCGIYLDLTSQKKSRIIDKRIEKVKVFIENHPSKRFSLDELKDISGLSKKYFTKIFKSQYGISPNAYQIRTRMNYARFLLEESGHSVKEAALTLGYPDQYSFSKQFKQTFGCPPSKIKYTKYMHRSL